MGGGSSKRTISFQGQVMRFCKTISFLFFSFSLSLSRSRPFLLFFQTQGCFF